MVFPWFSHGFPIKNGDFLVPTESGALLSSQPCRASTGRPRKGDPGDPRLQAWTLPEKTWIYMDLLWIVYGFIWIYMDLYGFTWIYMDLYGFSAGFCDGSSITWIVYGYSMDLWWICDGDNHGKHPKKVISYQYIDHYNIEVLNAKICTSSYHIPTQK